MRSHLPELHHLEAFNALCAEQSFTGAAERLGCTQPAVSYRIRALERALKTRLVERGGRRVLLTPAGRRLEALCQRFVGELLAARGDWGRSFNAEPWRIHTVSGFGRYVLVPALHDMLRDSNQRLRLNLQFDTVETVLHALLEGKCDLAFVYTKRLSSRLSYRAVYNEELVMVIAPDAGARLMAGGGDRPEVLEKVPFVTYEESDYVFGRWFDVVFGRQPDRTSSIHHLGELEEAIGLVQQGAGATIVPRDSVESSLKAGRLIPVYPAERPVCTNQVFAVIRTGGFVRPETDNLIARLRTRGPQVRTGDASASE